ncbi:uncharacterized protein GIQ15_02331 [Arthroderma uncinatum]|uniref:uncharacterized protein n=1 Tax=Arthroderma uncinatum TaxID=74035 RepID=UPI00144AAE0B|nr:uncharacterized protein GIQ15_02331 [Arthroderma uncinatum]KAF3483007.1 hypothetical protein GIQ15_02331 [Arthroderma uncinatum]
MAVDYRHGVAIFSLIIYLPCVFVSIYVALRHGFAKAAGWYFLVVFSIVRTVGACLQLATIANPTEGLFTGAAVCNSIGTTPLILACVGLLQRANNSITNKGQKGVVPVVFRAIATLALVGLILAIVGITSQDDMMHYVPNGKTKAAILVTLAVWVIVAGLLFMLYGRKKYLPAGENRLLLAVAISLPFILVRLIYSLISAFTRNPRFSIFSGDVTIYLVMAVLEEMIVVITCIAIGVTLNTDGVSGYQGVQIRSESPSTEEMKPYQARHGDQSGRGGDNQYRHGVVSSNV